MNATDPKCVVCGDPAAGACEKCGLAYCVHHRGGEALPGEPPFEGEEGPALCWNCRASGNARAVLFWTILAAAGLVALVAFFSLWS